MGNLKTRLARIEAGIGEAQDRLAGVLSIPRGVRPLDVLAKATPGLWLLVCDVTMEGLLGRVTSRGKHEIIFGGQHAQH